MIRTTASRLFDYCLLRQKKFTCVNLKFAHFIIGYKQKNIFHFQIQTICNSLFLKVMQILLLKAKLNVCFSIPATAYGLYCMNTISPLCKHVSINSCSISVKYKKYIEKCCKAPPPPSHKRDDDICLSIILGPER